MPPSPKNEARKRSVSITGPSEVAPGVFVGGWREAAGFDGARFCVLDELEEGLPSATHIPVYDPRSDRAIRSNLDRVARAMLHERAQGTPVVVFCGHGVRRSPLAAAWYLHLAEGLPLDKAYARIRAARPQVQEAKEWIGDLSDLD